MKIGAVIVVAIAGAGAGWVIAGLTYPDQAAARQAAQALIPDGAANVHVGQIAGWRPMVGPYRVLGEFEEGGRDKAELLDEVIALAVAEGWTVGEPIEHPAATELPLRRPPLYGAVTVFGPPERQNLGGHLDLQYDEGVTDRPLIGAAVGATVALLVALVVFRVRPEAAS